MGMPNRASGAQSAATGAKGWLVPALFAAVLSTFAAPAQAGWFDRDPDPATVQAEGASHKGPSAYHKMCAREPKLCMYDRQASRDQTAGPAAPMDEARWEQLLEINDRLNDTIRAVEDYRNYGVTDYWTIGHSSGDCEDYIIAKKHALIDAGWAPDQLLYAVVEGRYSEYHAVLVVRTEWGDYVLDNLTGQIAPWEETDYRFIVRQSAASPHKWVRIAGRATTVAATANGGNVTR